MTRAGDVKAFWSPTHSLCHPADEDLSAGTPGCEWMGHRSWCVYIGDMECTEGLERLENAFVSVGEVELVGAVVIKKEGVGEGLEIAVDLVDRDAVGCGKRAADEHGRSIANESGDGGVSEWGAANVGEGCVDAVAEILS